MEDREHRCSMCSFFTGCQEQLVNHLIRRHQSDKNFIVHCSSKACCASFRTLNSFKSHVARKHSSGTVGVTDRFPNFEDNFDLDTLSIGPDNPLYHAVHGLRVLICSSLDLATE